MFLSVVLYLIVVLLVCCVVPIVILLCCTYSCFVYVCKYSVVSLCPLYCCPPAWKNGGAECWG